MFIFLLGLHLWHIEFPRLGVKSELQLQANAIATATPDLSWVWNLCHSWGNARSLTHWVRPRIELASSWILVRFLTSWAIVGMPAHIYIYIFFFLGPHLRHMEVPRGPVELQLPAYTTATTATGDPSLVCDLRYSSWQWQILDPLSEARGWTCNLMISSRIRFCCAMMGTPSTYFYLFIYFLRARIQKFFNLFIFFPRSNFILALLPTHIFKK